jgi:nucleoside-diphosphate-sugar epimerase
MKIVVIGGAGVVGTKVVQTLRDRGHDAVPASPVRVSTRLPGKASPTHYPVRTRLLTYPIRRHSTTIR